MKHRKQSHSIMLQQQRKQQQLTYRQNKGMEMSEQRIRKRMTTE